MKLQQPARQRAAQHQRQRQAEVEQAQRLTAALRGEPVGEVENDPREEPGFGDAQQEAQDVEGLGVVGEHHRRRHQAPGDHDPTQPDLRAQAVQHVVARYFEERVADEEDARAKRERRIAQTGVRLQRRLGEADVGAIDERENVHQDQERQQTQPAFGDGAGQSQDGIWTGHLMFP
ncbi:hypothetical protein D3C73_1156770 [compost metagenome]